MKSSTISLLAVLALALAASPALAQEPEPEPEGDEVELGDEPLGTDSGELGGAEENPDAPRLPGEPEPEGNAGAAAAKADGPYPLELAQRPLTLYAGMSQVELELGTTFDPLIAPAVVRAGYGVTREIEIGLRYGAGALNNDEFADTYVVGKAVAIDARYLIEDWIAAQLSVPILLDPFSMAVELGAPMLFRFDKFSLFVGEDLVAIKINRLIPNVENAAATEALKLADDVGTQLADAEIRILGGVNYTIKPDLAFTGEIGYIKAIDAPDAVDSSTVPLTLSITKSKSNMLDFGARAFIGDFDDVQGTVGVSIFGALRI
jgi:hypothetical protein